MAPAPASLLDQLLPPAASLGRPGGVPLDLAGLGQSVPDLRGHADRLWKFLDELAESDPQAYGEYLQKQARAAGVQLPGKPAGSASTSSGTEGAQATEERGQSEAAMPSILLDAAWQSTPASSGGPGQPAGRAVIALFRASTSCAPLAGPTVASGQPVTASTCGEGWRGLRIAFRERQAPLQRSQGGAAVTLYELEASPATVDLAAAGAPAHFRAMLAEAAMRHVEAQHGVRLSRSGRRLQVLRKELPVHEAAAGDAAASAEAAQRAAAGTAAEALPPALLQQLSSLALPSGQGQAAQPSVGGSASAGAQPQGRPGPRRGPLIQELPDVQETSSATPSSPPQQPPPPPEYSLCELGTAAGAPRRCRVSVALPHLASAGQVDLQAQGASLLLAAGPPAAPLRVQLPWLPDSAAMRARFDKAARCLTVTLQEAV